MRNGINEQLGKLTTTMWRAAAAAAAAHGNNHSQSKLSGIMFCLFCFQMCVHTKVGKKRPTLRRFGFGWIGAEKKVTHREVAQVLKYCYYTIETCRRGIDFSRILFVLHTILIINSITIRSYGIFHSSDFNRIDSVFLNYGVNTGDGCHAFYLYGYIAATRSHHKFYNVMHLLLLHCTMFPNRKSNNNFSIRHFNIYTNFY